MQKLVEGIHQFQNDIFSSKQRLFERLVDGQHPLALFITCSDSRIDPSLLTQTEPGELFIMRNAGNIVPPYGTINGGEAATIEFAVSALGVKDIVICGHSHCGAMNGVLKPRERSTISRRYATGCPMPIPRSASCERTTNTLPMPTPA